MFKLVVLPFLVAVAVAAPAPGLLHGGLSYAIPTAVSHQSRIDIHNSPILAHSYSVATPLVSHHLAAPIISALPAVSHTSRVDLHRSALIATPYLGHGLGVLGVHGW